MVADKKTMKGESTVAVGPKVQDPTQGAGDVVFGKRMTRVPSRLLPPFKCRVIWRNVLIDMTIKVRELKCNDKMSCHVA